MGKGLGGKRDTKTYKNALFQEPQAVVNGHPLTSKGAINRSPKQRGGPGLFFSNLFWTFGWLQLRRDRGDRPERFHSCGAFGCPGCRKKRTSLMRSLESAKARARSEETVWQNDETFGSQRRNRLNSQKTWGEELHHVAAALGT